MVIDTQKMQGKGYFLYPLMYEMEKNLPWRDYIEDKLCCSSLVRFLEGTLEFTYKDFRWLNEKYLDGDYPEIKEFFYYSNGFLFKEDGVTPVGRSIDYGSDGYKLKITSGKVTIDFVSK